jgi:hypothetical protein
MAAMYKIIGSDQAEYGPVSAGQIREWIAEGRANDQTLVQQVGTSEWKPLGAWAELAAPAPLFPAGTTSATSPLEPAPMPAMPMPRQKVDSYLVPAILSTLCCCLPCGIVAIFYASQVSSKWSAGDDAGAKAAAKNAQLWCWVSFGLGAAWLILWLGFVFGEARGGFRL